LIDNLTGNEQAVVYSKHNCICTADTVEGHLLKYVPLTVKMSNHYPNIYISLNCVIIIIIERVLVSLSRKKFGEHCTSVNVTK